MANPHRHLYNYTQTQEPAVPRRRQVAAAAAAAAAAPPPPRAPMPSSSQVLAELEDLPLTHAWQSQTTDDDEWAPHPGPDFDFRVVEEEAARRAEEEGRLDGPSPTPPPLSDADRFFLAAARVHAERMAIAAAADEEDMEVTLSVGTIRALLLLATPADATGPRTTAALARLRAQLMAALPAGVSHLVS